MIAHDNHIMIYVTPLTTPNKGRCSQPLLSSYLTQTRDLSTPQDDRGGMGSTTIMKWGHTSPTPNTQGLCTSCVHSIGGCGFVIGTCSVGDKTQIPCSHTAEAHQADTTEL